MIEVDGLQKNYRETIALDGFGFRADDGRITGLLGPNGAGKTTALRSLCGLVKPDGGSIRIDGIDPAVEPLKSRKQLGVVPDRSGNYPRLTVREQLHFFGALHGMSESCRDEAIASVTRTFSMEDILDRRSKGFSQGQRAKLNLAIATLHRPRNIILDEPSVGLDVMSTRALRQMLAELRAQGRCVLFSSHVMQEVVALCDRVVVLVDGRTVAQGTADEICELTGEATLEDAFVKLTGEEGVSV